MSNTVTVVPPATGETSKVVGYTAERRINGEWVRDTVLGAWCDLYSAAGQAEYFKSVAKSPEDVRIIKITVTATAEVLE